MATLKERLVDLSKAIAVNFKARDERIKEVATLANGNETSNNALLTTVKENLLLAINEVFRMGRDNARDIAALAKQIGESGMGSGIKTWPAYPPKNLQVGEASTLILPGDEFRASAGFQCETHDIGFCFAPGQKAAFDGSSQTIVVPAGEFNNYDGWGTGPISAIARAPLGSTDPVTFPATLNLTVIGRTSETAPFPTKLTGDQRLAYLPDATDSRLLDALRTFINDMDDNANPNSNTLNALSSLIIAGSTPGNGLIDLIQPELGPYQLNNGANGRTIEHKPYAYWKGDGVDQFIGSRRSAANLKWAPDSHGIIAKIAGTDVQADGMIAGMSLSYYLQPHRSALLAGLRDGTGLETISAVPGDWVGMNRNNSAGFTGWVGEKKTYYERPALTEAPKATFNWLANNNSGQTFVGPCRLPLEVGCTFRGFVLDSTYLKVLRGLQKVNAVQQLIAAERA